MTKRGALLLFVLSALAPGAGAEGFGLAFKAGSTGLGGELTVGLTSSLNLRLGAQGFGYGYDRTIAARIDSVGILSLASGSAVLRLASRGSVFWFSGGLLIQGNQATGLAVPRGVVTIGDTTYPANAVGDITAEADFPRTVARFLLLGPAVLFGLRGHWRRHSAGCDRMAVTAGARGPGGRS